MKKRGLIVFFIFVIFSLSLISALDNSTGQTQIDKAYKCLTDKISGKCSTLTAEEKAFSLLSINQCQTELLSDSSNSGQCWPSSSCTIKTTAQAVLALNNAGASTQKAQDWLFSQNSTPTELVWDVEIESANATSCSIQYSGQSYTVNIDQNKQLSSNAGNCLTLDQNNYWLRVSPSCYNKEFSITCSNNFLTTTLFRKSTSSTIHVSDQTSSAAAGGTTKETVKSSCFGKGTSCNYEGSLWTALVLNTLGKDVSPYLPYLIIMADENQKFLPNAFLYALTAKSNFKISLLSQQKSNQYWMESGDKFYDTALALYPLQQETPQGKTNAQNWLLSSQDSLGCWEGNIRNTGFILASVWPRNLASSGGGLGNGTSLPNCQNAGYFCTNSGACTGQNLLSQFSCTSSIQQCCSSAPKNQTCSQLGGNICSSNQRCIGGTIVDSADAVSPQLCCAGGSCSTTSTTQSDCQTNNGICRAGGCSSNEQVGTFSCSLSGDTCCIQNTSVSGPPPSYWWIWVLLVLIIIVVIGIIFRDNFRRFWFKINSGGKAKPGQQPPRSPPYYPFMGRPIQRASERRIMPPSEPVRRRPSRSQSELDEVLRKLKEMGK